MADYLHIEFESKVYSGDLEKDLKEFVLDKCSEKIPHKIEKYFCNGKYQHCLPINTDPIFE
jgi:hypothetical protein